MTSEQLAAEHREFLIRTEKQSAILLAAEFARMKVEFAEYLTANYASGVVGATTLANLYAKTFLARTLLFLDNQIERMAVPFSQIVSRAQRRMINYASGSLKRYLPETSSSIFEPDREAIQKLIGRTQNGTSLAKFFARMRQPIGERARETLIEGFTRGESSQAIAKRINDACDIGQYRALTIARTESLSAYRSATVEHYQAIRGIIGYKFVSSLDARTCIICWALYGKTFKLNKKPSIHINCRCVLLPVFADGSKNGDPNSKFNQTGIEQFNLLEAGYQKHILGGKRFDLYQKQYSLDNFVESKLDKEYGQIYSVKPLADFEN